MENKTKILKLLNNINRTGVERLTAWLINNDFFDALCSTKHHLNVKGGLAEYSLNVFELLKEKNKRYKLGLSYSSIIICGLLHNVCKVNFYELVPANWDKLKEAYYKTNDKFPMGHGEKSVIIIQRFIQLTDEEACIIRWHMAAFDLSEYGKRSYYSALKLYPACLALHTADYESTVLIEDRGKNGYNKQS